MDSSLDAPLEVSDTLDIGSGEVPVNSSEGQTAPQIDNAELTKFFGYSPGDTITNGAREYMQTIWNYFAEGAKTPGEVIRRISEAEREVAPPQPGENRLGKFYTYVRLLEQERSVKDELKAYKK